MRKVKCIDQGDKLFLKLGCNYEVSSEDDNYLYIICDDRLVGPWLKSRFIDVSFNEYLNRLK